MNGDKIGGRCYSGVTAGLRDPPALLKLTIRHDSWSSAVPYLDGARLAIRRVHTLAGVYRGLDTILEL